MQAHVTPRNVYVLLTGRAGELAFFKIPRLVQAHGAVGARGLPLVNLVAGFVFVIHDIAARPGGSWEFGCDVFAMPTLLPPAGVLATTLQEVARARTGPVPDPAATTDAAPDPVPAVIVPSARAPVPTPPPAPRPPSARLRARENPLFSTALSRASHLKAVCLGGSAAPPTLSSASALLSDFELHALGNVCDLDAPAMAALTTACAMVSLGAS
jgi:hypothetical protein